MDYTTAWAATTGDINDASGVLLIGQTNVGGFKCMRTFLPFDTSSLPDASLLTEAKLCIYCGGDLTGNEFNIVIQTGINATYPHFPLESGDYDKSKYTGNGGQASTSDFPFKLEFWINITLNSNGLVFINKAGITKLCIRSSRDIAGTQPDKEEYFTAFSYEDSAERRPYLYIKYEYVEEEEDQQIEDWSLPEPEPYDEILEPIAKTVGPTLSEYGLWIIIAIILFLLITGAYTELSKKRIYRRPRGPTSRTFRSRKRKKPRGPKRRFR